LYTTFQPCAILLQRQAEIVATSDANAIFLRTKAPRGTLRIAGPHQRGTGAATRNVGFTV
jgi:hypothetical protein